MILGAIIGDIVGSQFEGTKAMTKDFPLFGSACRVTDDSILTLAVADALENSIPFAFNLKKFYRLYPHAGFGGGFTEWAKNHVCEKNDSYGNGAVMRISPVGYLTELGEVLITAKKATECSHNSPTAIKAAEVVAGCIWHARNDLPFWGYIYNQGIKVESVPPHAYGFYSAMATSSIAFSIIKETKSFEEAIRLACFLGGDTDTLGAVTGSLAAPLWGIPDSIKKRALTYLDLFQKEIYLTFCEKYGINS